MCCLLCSRATADAWGCGFFRGVLKNVSRRDVVGVFLGSHMCGGVSLGFGVPAPRCGNRGGGERSKIVDHACSFFAAEIYVRGAVGQIVAVEALVVTKITAGGEIIFSVLFFFFVKV